MSINNDLDTAGLATATPTLSDSIIIKDADDSSKLKLTTLAEMGALLGGSTLSLATVTLSSADIKGMYASPVLCIAAPGSGKTILVDYFAAEYTYGAATYTGGGSVYLSWGSDPGLSTGVYSTFVSSASFVNNTVDTTVAYSAQGATNPGVASSVSTNAGIYITNATAAFATGDGTVTLYIWYRTIPETAVPAGALLSTTVDLSSAQILGMYATPVELLPAPGAGFFISVGSISYILNYGGTPFAGGGAIKPVYDGDTTALALSISGSVITQSADWISTVEGDQTITLASTSIENKAVQLTNITGAFTGGTGSTVRVVISHFTAATGL